MSKPRKLAEWTKKSVAIWKATSAHRHAWVFRDPVDAEKLNLHDYHEVIKEPMDLGTVKSKLEAGSYDHPDQWEREMRLIFKNAKRYNPPGTDVHIMAEQVEEVFERKWAEAKQTVLQKYEEEQHMGAAAEAAPRAAAKTGKDKDRSSTKRLLESVNFSDDRAMSYEEKKQLSMDMNQLSSKKLGKIVEIIHYKHPKLLKQNESDPEEIEIDIDQIDDATLRGLQDFVAKALASSSSKKKRRTANGE
mmetsp:Transcript_141/g.288  ORF Transcript_141/g.288 Transcript_141/m.288 type:complete len:247 (-) Transcript_141:126-866(-)|eukprot:CAMPEP_0175855780 /NCGR_PEP_ID=MMETSP0107_2-20121207/28124_1 /TAXON_ID=195067 ORGANISM="Goniomonas pacifica, Strain CCMP1869" /NCGR_SAMPLE_ID=MMETSP0107_2 /ASSEMBLY_ACC=CAM_ASM_000203 /LENGTH=246 /DNA_ID=CAMNT_0017171795 /DNA_START=123 /DNA_END=863 /DNA_ORIENTATION=-